MFHEQGLAIIPYESIVHEQSLAIVPYRSMVNEQSLAIIPYRSIEEWRTSLITHQPQRESDSPTPSSEHSACKLIHRTKLISNRRVQVTRLISDDELSLVDNDLHDITRDSNGNMTCGAATNNDVWSNNETEANTDSDTSTSSCDHGIDGDVYEVEEITAVRAFRCGSSLLKQFRVSWVGFKDRSWVNEEDLNCKRLVDKFFKKRGSKDVEPLAGADVWSGDFNFDNWVSTSTILKHVQQWRNSNRHRTNVRVEPFNGMQEKDCIYILEHNCHFFVLMHYFETKLVYISDGTNLYSRRSAVRKEVNERLGRGLTISVLMNDIQRGEDFCGSSAAAISITFLQKYASCSWKNPLKVPPSLVSRLQATFHKHRSSKLGKSRGKIHKSGYYCQHCKRRFLKYHGLNNHERFCSRRLNE